ncbi:DUF3152 domain-containing protein [Stackebrandtia nassauensis]|uniref:DUF3152 domain-containing protein n=1 Tax=Stackebrandtia nassauensis (strain DSM 44728 / CIP 108903 / NRRL B-16338 / NBRC 102104 / LLR-40K-21) TaxID=446470 RepID=D3Q6J2_STANL|nr:DUF3152 domain-containing protein [Stackebrandtia nassauensis]ADD44235.1 hypothetical protein Snas_4591 [Stackebrandtia nassauensis DSM 44728]
MDPPRLRNVDPRLGGGDSEDRPRASARTDRVLARRRMWRKRRRAILLAVLLMMFSIAGVKVVRAATGADSSDAADYLTSHVADDSPSESASPTPSRTPSASATPSDKPVVVDEGNGKWSYAKKPDKSEKFGDEGTLLSYNVAVEGDIHADVKEFSEVIADTLADDRGWTAGDDWRFKPIGKSGQADFTVYLASPKTRAKLCGSEDSYTSCRNGDAVVINLERWLLGVPHWKKSLDSYRQYVINHEVGHRLGEGHVTCPKKGKPSPVMAQQTLELRGCQPNAWPYLDGKYVTGPAGEYQ